MQSLICSAQRELKAITCSTLFHQSVFVFTGATEDFVQVMLSYLSRQSLGPQSCSVTGRWQLSLMRTLILLHRASAVCTCRHVCITSEDKYADVHLSEVFSAAAATHLTAAVMTSTGRQEHVCLYCLFIMFFYTTKKNQYKSYIFEESKL